MFGFNKKNNYNDNFYSDWVKTSKAFMDKQKPYWDWLEGEGKRIYHLQTLIMKTYETVNIKAEICGRRLGETYINSEYLEDYSVFFKPEVFNKLREWCKEYETLCKAEEKVISEL